ncbi:hypothetical protein [Nocardia thailandica]
MARPEILAHIEADDALLDRSLYSLAWPHEAPERPFSAETAHLAMQRHAGCPAATCARKRAARDALVAAGQFVPDPRNSRNLERGVR